MVDIRSRIQTPLLAVDVVLRMDDGIVLIRRRNPPFRGCYALPGGFVEIGETVEDAARREVMEETGLTATLVRLVGVYSDPDRDPRGHVVSICYLADGSGELRYGSDASDVRLFSLDKLPELAFDHARMVRDALKAMV
ncbi:MAG TPA: NUDIX hydrolase [Methanothrix sp.]|nr:NUDIX hydrolase [Methanothrix sp.]HOK58441.1 NUDIX hydrolase [Methanothrix sp.]HOL43678.1 NUDIX hydrolase [Methanothrix sp.]HPO88647.1 NUDIX hydrolase [Methanothrix sp.]